jgi:hypothetical protein
LDIWVKYGAFSNRSDEVKLRPSLIFCDGRVTRLQTLGRSRGYRADRICIVNAEPLEEWRSRKGRKNEAYVKIPLFPSSSDDNVDISRLFLDPL